MDCTQEVCFELTPDPCGEALFEGQLDDILLNCPFTREGAEFEITDVGIFIYSEPGKELKALIKEHELEVKTYPTLIQFTGCYSLPRGNVLITGCLNLPTLQYESKYDSTVIEQYFNPFFALMILKNLQNGPLVATILLLPLSAFFCVCGLRSCIKRMCCKTQKNQLNNRQINQAGQVPNYPNRAISGRHARPHVQRSRRHH